MQPYQPFLIAPFGTGLDTDQEPWLLPVDAFSEISNGHIKHGYIQKRSGYRRLAQMAHGRAITAASNANPAVFTVGASTGLSNGDTVTLQYLSGGTWSSLNGAKYTITGLAGVTFSLLDSTGTAVDGTALGAYSASSGRVCDFAGLPIMGIFQYLSSTNSREILVADTERVGIYNSTSGLVDPLDLYDTTSTLQPNSDVFTSSDTDYIWAANWQHSNATNRVYFTNGKEYQTGAPGTDGILYYDAQNARVEQFQPSLGGTDYLLGAKLIFSFKQRLFVLNTYEGTAGSGTHHPQRVRWCKLQDPTNWIVEAGGGGFSDAATGDQIISAELLQDLIVVYFTNSVWTLRPTSDPALPVIWSKVNSFRACDARMGVTGYDRYTIAVGIRGITATDGTETRRIDNRIEDFVTEDVNASEFDKVFAERSYGERRTWYLFPYRDSTDVNSALIYDDDSAGFSKYSIDMNVLGQGSTRVDYAYQDFTAANNLDWTYDDAGEETFLSFFWSDNAEVLFGGDTTGNIHLMETGTTDNGSDIPFSLKSAGWNPFKEQGVECQLGYIDLYMDSEPDADVEVLFYKDDNPTSYAKARTDLLPNLNFRSTISDITINSDPTTGCVVTSGGHGLSSGDTIYFYGVKGATFFNDIEWTLGSTVTENTFSIDSDLTPYGYAITDISNANPAVVEAVDHGLQNGDRVYIVDVSGMTEVNDKSFTVANKTDDTFELQGIDSTAYTPYTPGGYAFAQYLNDGVLAERRFYRTKVWKRVYAGGIGYEHRVEIIEQSSNNPIKIHAFKPWFKSRGRRTLG